MVQAVEPDGSQSRSIGPLTIEIDINQTHAQVKIALMLSGTSVGRRVLDSEAAAWTFDTQSGAASASGVLKLEPQQTPQLSYVSADIKTRDGETETPFKGDVATWLWSDSLIYVEKRMDISSELNAVTTVRGFQRNMATVELYAVSQLLQQYSMTPTSPTSETMMNLQLGSVIVYKGATFKLTPPTSIQPGQVFMSGEFESTNIPKTSISQAIAIWSAPTAPAAEKEQSDG